MDAHHDRVLAARRALAGAPSRRYFGYSTILDRAALEEWKAQHGYGFFTLPAGEVAEALDVELVFDFPSRWWGGRVAGLTDQTGASVFGRLYEVAGSDWPILQHKEGAVTGMCIEREVRVRAGGEILSATAFTTRPERTANDGPVSTRFLAALQRGAEQAGLPPEYLARLRRMTPR